ncbi:MAG: hypothetical protein ACKOPO_08780, partial [Novosphingobium sp.]
FAVPSEASSLGYYVSHTHYLSALFASLSDLSRLSMIFSFSTVRLGSPLSADGFPAGALRAADLVLAIFLVFASALAGFRAGRTTGASAAASA